MKMTKPDLLVLLNSVGVPAREDEQYLDDLKTFPKIAYWEYNWEDDMASGDDYHVVVTYQVSFASRKPRDPKLLALKKALNDAGLHPTISHEYVTAAESPGYYHSYFGIDVIEDFA